MKIEGEQEIPSELTDQYRALLQLVRPDGTIQKRPPFEQPEWKDGGKKVSAAQIAQRTRFKKALGLFAGVSDAERERWYDARPEWNSMLWYYNYFMMSALAGNANNPQGGIGVVKSIQVAQGTIAVSGSTEIAIDTVDPTKTVAFLFGNSFISDLIHHYDGTMNDNAEITVNLSPSINPDIAEVKITGGGGYQVIEEGSGQGYWGDIIVSEVNAATIKLKLQQLESTATFGYSLDIIEHKSQTVYPIIDEINAENIKLKWPIEPSIATIISALVIEYI